ncbi:MAG TPA: zinc-binding alcohol dehydrogenase family protein [Myxococcota bacterium]|jgi:propanol-preferring alcohol dehydrogenase|nr:zinc-binding alcohol dehydrogenase family protein [Myxococcota bacterium]
MRAVLLERPGAPGERRLSFVERADPTPAAGEIVLHVTACGVCRTDLQLAAGDLPAKHLPIVPGHQAVGVVVSVGAGVDGWRVGERAGVAWLASACGVCTACCHGRENLCPEARFTGWDRDGGFATRVVVRADFALRLPAAFSDLAAAPLLCGGVIGYRALRVAGVGPDSHGMRLGLYGFGASALCAIQVARHFGCEVFVATRSLEERERARSLGAVWTGGYGDPVPEPLDAAVTFAPSGDVVVRALGALARGGTVVVNAIHLDRVPAFSYDLLWWERGIRSVANFTRRDAQEFLALAAEIPVRTAVERHPLHEAEHALVRLEAGEVRGAAVLEMPSDEDRR